MTEGMPARRFEMNKHYLMKTLAENPFGSTLPTPETRFPPARRHTVCSLLDTVHSLDRAARALNTFTITDEIELVALQRLRDRVDGIARLISEATESLKLVGVDKNDSFIEIDGELIGLQEVSRRIRKVQLELAEEYKSLERETRSGHGSRAALLAAPAAVPAVVVSVGSTVVAILTVIVAIVAAGVALVELTTQLEEKLTNLFNDTDDDQARERISAATPEEIQQRISDNELVSMIDAMLDGYTGDDDERAILKILDALDCARRIRIVELVGVGELLYNLDGSEYDRLLTLLADCGIIGIGDLDDDGSRYFVNTHSCSHLGQLSMSTVRQLVLNMFSGSCGDDDEDAILKLLRCQSRERLHQLVSMPGTDVGEFDYNFDGSQWDDLEAFFADNGIALD
jgi:hypothetical protein